jgi:hypothetical protein
MSSGSGKVIFHLGGGKMNEENQWPQPATPASSSVQLPIQLPVQLPASLPAPLPIPLPVPLPIPLPVQSTTTLSLSINDIWNSLVYEITNIFA